jgi:hypothetical protein
VVGQWVNTWSSKKKPPYFLTDGCTGKNESFDPR